MKKLKKPLLKTALGLSAGIGAVLLTIFLSRFSNFTEDYFKQIEDSMYDLNYKFKLEYSYGVAMEEEDTSSVKEDLTLEDRIQVVDIDERALMKLGNYSFWPRSHHAKVVDYLDQGGASAIMFDIMFKNADFGARDSKEANKLLTKISPNKNWEGEQADIRSFYNHDSVLLRSIQESEKVIIAATTGHRNSYRYETQWKPLSTVEWQKKLGMRHAMAPGSIDTATVVNWELMHNVFEEIAQASKYMGLINVMPDGDGKHRQLPMAQSWPKPKLSGVESPHFYMTASLATVAHLFGITMDDIKFKTGEHINLGKPLGIYRDSNGVLQTTYPNLTWPMIQSVIKKSTEIQNIQKMESKIRVVDICEKVRVYKEDDELAAEIFNAQDVTEALLLKIIQTPDMYEKIKQVSTTQEEIPLDEEELFTLSWDEDEELPLLTDNEEEEEVYLDSFSIAILQNYKNEIMTLEDGQNTFLSSSLNVKYDEHEHSLKSNFIILSKAVIEDIQKQGEEKFQALKNGEMMRLGKEIKIPIDDRNRMQINYTGMSKIDRNKRPFKQISYYDLIEERIDASAFQGKIFVLGSTAPSMFDFISSPHEKEYPGVLLHTTVLENILNENFMRKVSTYDTYLIALGIAILCAMLVTWLPPFVSVFTLLIVFVSHFLLSYHYYFLEGVYLGSAIPQISIFFTFLGVMIVRYFLEEREKKFINSTFKNYISPELIDQMVEAGERPSLGGKEGVLTAYFTDIASFSTFSEKIGSPSKLVELLNEYLTDMTDILLDHGGTLDKYEGDAIIAFFGAPVELPNHAQSACEAALGMQIRLLDLRKKWAAEGDKWPVIVHQMHMRIGLNTGPIVTGNMGSAVRMNYTMMGDAVNLAARLESGAKQYGVYTMCSQETLDATEGNLINRVIDKVKVMGKTLPVTTYELLAIEGQASPQILELVEKWEEARVLYEAMDWDNAIAKFRECEALEPFHPDRDPGSKTTPSNVFIERCEEYKLNPPVPEGESWDGVYTATSK